MAGRGHAAGIDGLVDPGANDLLGEFVRGQIEDPVNHAFGDQLLHGRSAGPRGVKGDGLETLFPEDPHSPARRGLGVAKGSHGNGPLTRRCNDPRPMFRHSDDGRHGIGEDGGDDRIGASQEVAHRKDHPDVLVSHIGTDVSGGDRGDKILGESEGQTLHRHGRNGRSLVSPQADHPIDLSFEKKKGKELPRPFSHDFHNSVPFARLQQGRELPAPLTRHFPVIDIRSDPGRTQGADIDDRGRTVQVFEAPTDIGGLFPFRVQRGQNGDGPFPDHFPTLPWKSLSPTPSRNGRANPSSPWEP